MLMLESLRYHMFRTVTKAVEQFESSDEGMGFYKEALQCFSRLLQYFLETNYMEKCLPEQFFCFNSITAEL